jgi:hypothetical protein
MSATRVLVPTCAATLHQAYGRESQQTHVLWRGTPVLLDTGLCLNPGTTRYWAVLEPRYY